MILMQNSYGYTVAITTNLDLTDATVIRMRLVPPAGATPIDKQLTQADVLTTDPITERTVPKTIGMVGLPIDQGDVAVKGFYSIEAYDETPGRVVPSSVGVFEVNPTLG